MRLNGRRKRIEKKFVILIIIVIVCIAIGIMSLIVRDDRQLSFVEKGIKDVVLRVEYVLYTPVRFVTNKIDNYKDMKRIYEKYKDSDSIDAKATLLEEENKELKSSIKELQDTLDIKTIITDYDTINATVINRNIGNWYNNLTIDKGSKNGIKTDMIVITKSGLIGKIIKTTYYTSEVKLITTADLNNKISVGITTDDTFTYGLLSGYDINSKQLIVSDIVDNTTIRVGDKVATSGLSELFPKGIIVGVVSKIESDEFGISKRVKVTPSADFNNLQYVSVLKGHDSLWLI